jgi:hypothetical protein
MRYPIRASKLVNRRLQNSFPPRDAIQILGLDQWVLWCAKIIDKRHQGGGSTPPMRRSSIEQLLYVLLFVPINDGCEDASQVVVRFDLVQFSGLDQRREHSPVLCTSVVAHE